jgi:hypothetical protein
MENYAKSFLILGYVFLLPILLEMAVKIDTQDYFNAGSLETSMPDDDLVILLDVDTRTLPLFLNLLLNLRIFLPKSEVVKHVRVLCLDTASCSIVQQLGLKMVFHAISAHVREGWMMVEHLEQVIGTHNYKKHNDIFGADKLLASEQLAREMALLQLLGEGRPVLRTDSDVCFFANPLTTATKHDVDIRVSVQSLRSDHEHGLWSYNWACPNNSVNSMELTLNNGIIYIDGRKEPVRRLYSLSVGVGLKMLDLSLNGWAQASFNTLMKSSKLCLRPSKTQALNSSVLIGTTEQGIRVASMDVLSPCEANMVSGAQEKVEPILAHANCMGSDYVSKAAWLTERGCWHLPGNWSAILESGKIRDLLEIFL